MKSLIVPHVAGFMGAIQKQIESQEKDLGSVESITKLTQPLKDCIEATTKLPKGTNLDFVRKGDDMVVMLNGEVKTVVHSKVSCCHCYLHNSFCFLANYLSLMAITYTISDIC
jgi:cytochrome c